MLTRINEVISQTEGEEEKTGEEREESGDAQLENNGTAQCEENIGAER